MSTIRPAMIRATAMRKSDPKSIGFSHGLELKYTFSNTARMHPPLLSRPLVTKSTTTICKYDHGKISRRSWVYSQPVRGRHMGPGPSASKISVRTCVRFSAVMFPLPQPLVGGHIGPGPSASKTVGRKRALPASTPKLYTQGVSGIHIGPGPAPSKTAAAKCSPLANSVYLGAQPLSGGHIGPGPAIRTAVGS
jgi:hypothetical protein